MVYQSISIDLFDTSDEINLGKLKIRAKINDDSKLVIESNSFKEDGIFYENVEKVKELDDETPIQYFLNEKEKNISQLVLLEETNYKLFFESNLTESSEKIFFLPSLTNQREDIIDIWDEDEGPVRANLNFRSYVGKSFFDVEVGGFKSKKYSFEVRSKKIGYHKQYDAMISDLAEVASGMIFEQNAPLLQEFDFGHDKRETLYEEFMFLEYLFRPDNLPYAYEFILRNPHFKLEKYSENVPTAFAHNIGPSELVEVVSKPEGLSKAHKTPSNWPEKMKGYIPETINHDFLEDTLDTPENRLLKYFLESVDKLISDLLSKIAEGNIRDKLLEFHEKMQSYLSDRWLMDIGNLDYIPMNSQVMQKKEGYRDIFKFYIYFEFAFRLKWRDMEDKLKGYERKLSDLYEEWCYIQLLNVLRELSGINLRFEDVYDVRFDEWSISLKKGRSNAQKFKWIYKNDPIEVRVIYGGRFSRESYSLTLKPDYVLQIIYYGERYLVHFDAKYKFQKKFLKYCKDLKSSNMEKLAEEEDEELYRSYKTEDVFKMHTYKDAIYGSLGAYVFYPGDRPEIFKEFNSTIIPSVGAFSLTPGGKELEEEEKEIKVFIEDILDFIVKYNYGN